MLRHFKVGCQSSGKHSHYRGVTAITCSAPVFGPHSATEDGRRAAEKQRRLREHNILTWTSLDAVREHCCPLLHQTCTFLFLRLPVPYYTLTFRVECFYSQATAAV